MLTADNFARNLETAKTLAAKSVGAASSVGLTYDQQRVYNRALAELISKYPGSFAPEIVAAAGRELSSSPHQALSSDSIGQLVTQFADASVDEGAKLIPQVGNKLFWGLVLVACIGALAYILPSGIARARR